MVAPKPSFPDARSPRATHRRRQWFDNSLQGNRGVKCSTSLPTTVAHNYARSPSFLLFIYGRLFNFFSPTSVRESLPFSLVLMDGPSTNSRTLPLDIVARLSLRFYAFERNGDYYFSQLGFIVSSMIEAWNQLININVSTKYNVKYSDELRINQEPTNLLFDASKKFLLLRSIFGR